MKFCPGVGAPVAQQPRLDVCAAAAVAQQGIVVEVDLADREVVGRPPVGVHLLERLGVGAFGRHSSLSPWTVVWTAGSMRCDWWARALPAAGGRLGGQHLARVQGHMGGMGGVENFFGGGDLHGGAVHDQDVMVGLDRRFVSHHAVLGMPMP